MWLRESVCVWVGVGERESVCECVCVWVWVRESVCECVCVDGWVGVGER